MASGEISGDLIKQALKLGTIIASGDTPTAEESNDALVKLNDLLEIWSLQNLAVYGTADISFPTVSNQKDYTIGPTGTWVTDRPVRINDDPYCTVNGVDFPIGIIGQADYDLIYLKDQPGQIIERLLFVNDSPNGRITLWPVPNAVVSITLSIDRVLAQVPDLFTVMSFPPGYLLAFKYTLAVMLCPEYGRVPPDDVKAIAVGALGNIKRANKVRRTAKCDAALLGTGVVIWQRGY